MLASPGLLLPFKQISKPTTSVSMWEKALGSTSNASELLPHVCVSFRFVLFCLVLLMGTGH